MKSHLILISLAIITMLPLSAQQKHNANHQYAGTYKFENPNNTSRPKEDHYIVLKIVNQQLTGYYYGTSDEFDDAREGYLPAFFVAPMQQITITNNTIRFTLKVTNDDFLTKPVNLSLTSTHDALQKHYKPWPNKITPSPKQYQGVFVDSQTIYFKGELDFLDKTFRKQP